MSGNRPVVTRVRISNYKSIRGCDVSLGPLTILVGPNGSDKSNFLDALRFTADALSTTLDLALRDRGGIKRGSPSLGRASEPFRDPARPCAPLGASGHYSFRIGAAPNGGFRVTDEECAIRWMDLDRGDAWFRLRDGQLKTNLEERLPAPADDRLYLVSASNVSAFRPVYDALTSMGFYNLSPSAIRQPQQPDAGTLLRRDGSNLAGVLGHLERHTQNALERVVEYLRLVAPGVEGVARRTVGPMETIEFRQRVAGRKEPWTFPGTGISDGTLRGLGVLVALLQSNGRPPTLVGVEEPDVALHPAAVAILIDAIRDSSRHTQVVVTSHSPDLLDRDDMDDSVMRAVVSEDGVTVIGPVSNLGRSALRDHLFTAGELLRMNQLEPNEEARGLSAATVDQLRLFEKRRVPSSSRSSSRGTVRSPPCRR